MMTKKLTLLVIAAFCSFILNAETYPSAGLFRIKNELTIKYDQYDKQCTDATKTKNGLEKHIEDFRVEYSPDRSRGVEYKDNELLRQNWSKGDISMVGARNYTRNENRWGPEFVCKYKYVFYNTKTGAVLYCGRETPIPDKDILKGDALKSSMKGSNAVYYSYYSKGKSLAGMPSNGLFSSGIAFYVNDKVYYLNHSDLSLKEYKISVERQGASYNSTKKAYEHREDAEMPSSIKVERYKTPEERRRILRQQKEAQEKKLQEEAKEKQEEAKEKLKLQNPEEYFKKYAINNHFLVWERNRFGPRHEYDFTYYYKNDKGQLMKATFRDRSNDWLNNPPDKTLEHMSSFREEDLKKKDWIAITNTVTGEIVYSYEIERQRKIEAEKAAAEKKEKAKRAALVKKYGAKYVDAALNGKIMIGMPLALVKETTDWFSVAVDTESSYRSYYYVYRKRYTGLGSFSLKYAYIGVSKGKISYINYID